MTNTPGIRSRNIFNPEINSKPEKPFKLSRSKLELFTECPRCFYLDRRLGVGRPPGFPFTLNNAVDTLLKKEFDIHRVDKSTHPLMEQYGIDAIPYQHEDMEKWRANFTGIQYLHEKTNLIITGAVDDIWVNPKGELIVVDYKATSTEYELSMDAEYRSGYKRQAEIYQWLLRQNGFKVSDMAYFVYANGKKDREAFDGKLEFTVQIFPHEGSDSWVEDTVINAHKCMMSDIEPEASVKCAYCDYRNAAKIVESN